MYSDSVELRNLLLEIDVQRLKVERDLLRAMQKQNRRGDPDSTD